VVRPLLHAHSADYRSRGVPSRAYHEALWEQIVPGQQPADTALRMRFLLADVSAGERVLDIGSGEGLFAAALLDAGASVLAADLAAEPLARAARSRPELETWLLPEEAEWGLADASFDVVWAGEVIEHVADTAGWLSECRRVLRPGGRLLATTPDHGPLTRLRMGLSAGAFAARLDPLGEHLRLYTRRSLAGVLAGFGFSEITVRGAGGVPGARRVLLVRAVRGRW
jgi:2-polyprenyl-3-methyl-5-hydroxy-6-metoxy-1,4-benzoquinol methylase